MRAKESNYATALLDQSDDASATTLLLANAISCLVSQTESRREDTRCIRSSWRLTAAFAVDAVKTTITPIELAQLLILSEQELVGLTKQGILQRTTEMRNGRRRIVYVERASVQSYIRHLRSPAEEARKEFLLEKSQTQRIIRAHKELELGLAKGELIPKSRVVFVVGSLLSTVKNHVLAIASRCSRLLLGLDTVKEIHTLLSKNLELALREMSEFDMDDLTNTRKGSGTNGQHKTRTAKRATRARQ